MIKRLFILATIVFLTQCSTNKKEEKIITIYESLPCPEASVGKGTERLYKFSDDKAARSENIAYMIEVDKIDSSCKTTANNDKGQYPKGTTITFNIGGSLSATAYNLAKNPKITAPLYIALVNEKGQIVKKKRLNIKATLPRRNQNYKIVIPKTLINYTFGEDTNSSKYILLLGMVVDSVQLHYNRENPIPEQPFL